MKPLVWVMRFVNGSKAPWILVDISEERKKQAYIRINKILNGR